MRPNAAFQALVAVALCAAALLAAAATRFLRAGMPGAGRAERMTTWHGVLIPGSGDLYIHLVSYVLLGLVLSSSFRALRLAARRLRRTRAFLDDRLIAPGARPPAFARAVARAGLAGRVDCVASADPVAFCYGIRRPRVAISTGLLALLDERELEAVLRHEAYHLGNRDPLRLIVADTLAAAFRFLPLVGMLRDHHAVAQELAADRYAVRALGTDRGLAAALYKLLTGTGAHAPVPGPGATGALALRIDALLGSHIPPRHHIHLGGLCWTAGVTAAMLLLLVVPLHLLTGPPPSVANILATILR